MKALKKLNLKKVILCYILIYFIIAGMYCGINGTRLAGEWDDYIYPAVTLMTEGHISISEEDVPIIKEFFPEWYDEIDNNGIDFLSGRYTKNGGALTWYFPTYAIACIPMIIILQLLGLSATYAFTFTNLISVILMLLIIYKYLNADDRIKFILIMLLSINPVMFYYCWPSGEVLIYSFLAIGIVFWYNKWYKLAAVFVSLAGTLNVTIMSIGIIMIVEYMISLLKKKSEKIEWKEFIKNNFFRVIQYGSCYIIGLVPMAYFYYNTGYINLTSSYETFTTGTEKTWQRALAYLFDLNFGIFPYYLCILIIGIMLFFAAIIYKNWKYLEWFSAFMINVILYSVMVHINNGMSGIARYNVWGVLILIFAVCLFFEEIIEGKHLQMIVKGGILVNVGLLMIIVYSYGPTYAEKTSYEDWTPIAAWVLEKYPSLYNPLHSTFYTRTMHDAGVYSYDTPVIYCAEDGYVRKILATGKDQRILSKMYLSAENGQQWFENQISKLGNKEKYISVPLKYKIVECHEYTLGESILFYQEGYNAEKYVVYGLSETREDWGTWTDGNEFIMRLKTTSESELLHGKIVGNVYNGQQSILIYVNNKLVYEGITKGQDIEFDFSNPGIDKVIEIKIEMPEAISPLEKNESQDTRKLALGLSSIIITESK